MPSSPSITVYNLLAYFSRQPADIRCCPICSSSLSRSDIAPSRAALDALAAGQFLIPAHNFSRLYTCDVCHWWAVWESWGYYECNSQADYLIVAGETDRAADKTNQQASPWNEILKIASIYASAKVLPDTLGELFVGGERMALKLNRPREIPPEIPKDSLFDKFIARIARIRRKRN